MKATTVVGYFYGVRAMKEQLGCHSLAELVLLAPIELEWYWARKIKPFVSYETASSLRAMLHALAALEIAEWRPHDAVRIRYSIRSPLRDRFRKIRLGDSYLRAYEQARVVDRLDHFSSTVTHATPDVLIFEAAVLVLGFQHALRPGQSARLRRSETEVYDDGSIQLAVPYLKQPKGTPRRVSLRSIRIEWVPIFRELIARSAKNAEDRLLPLTPHEVSRVTKSALSGIGLDRTATDLRHTGAQRLADRGGSLHDIMELLTHESSKIAQVYVDSSPSQARIINDALGLSPFYRDIPAKHARRFVNRAALEEMSPDRRVSGVPHGFPTGTIGGCTSGQSMCARTPVLACYTCHKFMPSADREVHRGVETGLRSVVQRFRDAGSWQEGSPVFYQLGVTIGAVGDVIRTLESRQDEDRDEKL
ncbi:tyrosine-type recombinase/integrase [Rhizobium sp. BK376]|uniref:tyrosine-type recombinase/integrase n=1 Tax=Rhizobium sp. BK376 TaxID=2512149 RepID=UPI001404DEEE|nr:tyrosine-type recombinase/integrase [Rhizobium sp. BK376]